MPVASALPGVKRVPKPNGLFTWYWAASQVVRKNADYYPRTVRLWHGQGQPSAAELDAIGLKAERLTIELEEWLSDPKDRNRARRLRQSAGTIYFLRAGQMVKIGISKNPVRRIATLRTAVPGDVELLLTLPGSHDRAGASPALSTSS